MFILYIIRTLHHYIFLVHRLNKQFSLNFIKQYGELSITNQNILFVIIYAANKKYIMLQVKYNNNNNNNNNTNNNNNFIIIIIKKKKRKKHPYS